MFMGLALHYLGKREYIALNTNDKNPITFQFNNWTLMINKILNCFITYFMSGPLTLQQNRFGWGKIFFQHSTGGVTRNFVSKKSGPHHCHK